MDLPVEALFSTLGRTAARALETEYCAELQQYFFDKLMTNIRNGDESTANIEKWDPSDLARLHPGRRLHRGAARCARALGHDRGRPDRELPMRGSHHLERIAPRQCRAISGPSRPRF
jgi:hypothetical protein